MDIQTMLPNEKKQRILKNVEVLIQLHKSGALGGEVMPEDRNPGLGVYSDENFLYFTLPMALNYQRNSYKLWEAAKKTYEDEEIMDVFSPSKVVEMDIEELRKKLLKYKVALQPNRHPQIWMELSRTFSNDFCGSVKTFFMNCDYTISKVKSYMLSHKKQFPYLSGAKIMNYWLYVMEQYTSASFIDRENITVAPDTHVLQASAKLGLIDFGDIDKPNIRETVSDLWNSIFEDSTRCPIDIHTPLWLWSRGGFIISLDNIGVELENISG